MVAFCAPFPGAHRAAVRRECALGAFGDAGDTERSRSGDWGQSAGGSRMPSTLVLAVGENPRMELRDVPVRDPREAIAQERDDLLGLLEGLSDDEWVAPTEAGKWRVKDVALHLLDGDLGWISRGRDADTSGLLPTDGDYRDFVLSLDTKNQRWVLGAGGLSRRVVVDLLRWSGSEIDDYYWSIDLEGPGGVIWASNNSVPRWFDLCRDLTERWVHQQHIRDAVARPGTHHRFLPEILGTFVWAFPHHGSRQHGGADRTRRRWNLASDPLGQSLEPRARSSVRADGARRALRGNGMATAHRPTRARRLHPHRRARPSRAPTPAGTRNHRLTAPSPGVLAHCRVGS